MKENEQSKNQNIYNALYEQSPIAIEIYDSNGKLMEVNPACLELFGVNSVEEVVGFNLFQDPNIPADSKEKLSKGEHVQYESEFDFELVKKLKLYKTYKTGKMYIDVFITPLESVLFTNEKYIVFIHDITVRKNVEEKLAFQASLLEQVHNGIITIDFNNKILSWNKFAEKLYQWKSEEAIGKDIIELLSPVEMKETVYENFEKLNREGHWEGEFNVKRKDGSTIPAHIVNTYLKDINGNNIGFIGISADITERKKLQEQLIQSEKLSALGQLAAGIAHEFNNILSIISTTSQVSQLHINDTEKLSKYIKTILKQAKRGADIVEKMIAFAKPKEPKKEICDIGFVIDEVISLKRKILKLDNVKIERKYNHKNSVNVDTGQMQQVFMNLINNTHDAIKPLRRGKIQISIKDMEDKVEIRFSDTGIGMDEETSRNIFNPFFTTKGARAEDDLGIKGTGLGLSVTHTIIQNHEGSITVESKKGEGTTFIITIPVAVVEAEKEKDKDDISWKKESAETKGLKILVIDDEKDLTEILQDMLAHYGYKNVAVVNSGEEAIQIFQEQRFDIVFLDITLPDMDGEQIFEELIKLDPDIAVIYISGHLGLNQEELINKGAYGFIQKPFDMKDIFSILNEIIHIKEKA